MYMKTKGSTGFVLVELLVYLVVAVLLLSVIAYFILSTYFLYSDTVARSQADRAGGAIIGQIVRETRSGTGIDINNSSLESNIGYVTIETTSGSTVFSVVDDIMQVQIDDGTALSLSPDTQSVSRFYITQITTPVSQAIRYELAITYDIRDGQETRTYTGLAILRESYD